MAATDQHYRSQKTLDIVFGVSCAAMFFSTIWMFAQDYNREFKTVQRTFRDVESTIAEREMLDKLPSPDEAKEKRLAVTKARRRLSVAGAKAQLEKKGEGAKFDELYATWRDGKQPDADREKARAELESLHREFLAEEKKLIARREVLDAVYRGIKADFDSQMSYLNIAVDETSQYPKDTEEHKKYDKEASAIRAKVQDLEKQLGVARKNLDELDAQIKTAIRQPLKPFEDALAKAEDDQKRLTGTFDRFAKVAAQKAWSPYDTLRAMPILDGFESPLKPKQQWLPDLTIDYGGFRDVPRYDRCTTCHLGIERSNFDKEMLVRLGDEQENSRLRDKLSTATEQLEKRLDSGENLGFDPSYLPGEVKGGFGLIALLLVLSALVAGVSLGLLERSWRLGLVITMVGMGLSLIGTGVFSFVAPRTPTVKTIKLTEGQITQYCAHPRLELFVDSNSPHPVEKFGCTICHAGQGSATDFSLATHTPSDAKQEHKWQKEYNYHPSHYWDFPMLSSRFIESSCLKCHHQVTDLVSNGSKQEAPKLTRGFDLIRENGCYGCHEIQGQKSGRAVGPDMRLEPAPAMDWLSAADQEKAKSDPANLPGTYRKVGPSLRRLSEKVGVDWTTKWINEPRGFRPDTKMPHFYNLTTNNVENLPDDQKNFPATEIHAISHYLINESKAHLGSTDAYRQAILHGDQKAKTKQLNQMGLLDLQKVLIDRATAKAGSTSRRTLGDREMKELLDLVKRFGDLALLSSPTQNQAINGYTLRQRQLIEQISEVGRRLEAVEGIPAEAEPLATQIAAAARELNTITDSLVAAAQVVPITRQLVNGDGDQVTLPAKGGDAAKGIKLFIEKGCLACHAHEGSTKDPAGKPTKMGVHSDASFGPELSRIADKLAPALDKADARLWLVQWLLNPNIYHPRTRMPITHLSTEQADDIAAWLLSQKTNWQGSQTAPATPTRRDYIELARVYLLKAPGMTPDEVESKYLPRESSTAPGIPEARLASYPRDADERVLIAPDKGEVSEEALRWYVGKKAIGRLGCFACHDIPGFETAKPIGVGLNDWGKKDGDKLAFEDAEAFLKSHFNIVPSRNLTRAEAEAKATALWRKGAERIPDAQEADREALLAFLNDRERVVGALTDKKNVPEEMAKRLGEATARLDKADAAELKKLIKRFEVQAAIKDLENAALTAGLSVQQTKELEELRPLKFFEVVDGKKPFEEIFAEAINHHQREGFLQLKLAEPRSYDYNRRVKWDDRLRMPQFQFARTRQKAGESDEAYKARKEKEEAEAREAVMTFVLGLVAEPIPTKYLHTPKPEKQAEITGRLTLEKFNCASCHQIRPGIYEFKLTSEVQAALTKAQTTNQLSMAKDHPYLNHNAWFGSPQTSDRLTAFGYIDPAETKTLRDNGENADQFHLQEALRYHGSDRIVRNLPAGATIALPAGSYQATPGYGGTWADLMQSYALKLPVSQNKPEVARSILPPSLAREGERVQPDWLYKFLLNPGPIRPQSYMLLRMPKFNMSSEDSRALVNYFAATAKTTNPGAGIVYPYVSVPQRDNEFWTRKNRDYKSSVARELEDMKKQAAATKDDGQKKALEKRAKEIQAFLDQKAPATKDPAHADLYSASAYKLITHRDMCIKCHPVGNFTIEGPQGPNLAQAAGRLRPEWVEQWIANPQRFMGYNPVMPQNFNYELSGDPLKWERQDLFVGSPIQQTRAVRDLLMDSNRLTDLLATQPPAPPTPAAPGGSK